MKLESVNFRLGVHHPSHPGTDMQFRADKGFDIEDLGHAVRVTREGVSIRVPMSQVELMVEAQVAPAKAAKGGRGA